MLRVVDRPRTIASIAIGGLLVVAAQASGCARSEAVAPEPTSASAKSPQHGGVVRLLEEAPQSLDPVDVESIYEALPVGQIFDGLVALDAGLNVVPALADSWTISRDGRDYVIHLRKGVTFHDGSPLLAEDVVFSFRRVLAPTRASKSFAASYLRIVEGAPEFSAGKSDRLPGLVAVDTSHVEIRLARPYVSFLAVLAMDDLRIVPAHVVTARGESAFRRAPVGTGPFRFGSWSDTELRLDAAASHFGRPVYLDRIVVAFPRPDERDSGISRFLRGELELVRPTSDSLASLRRDRTVEIHRYQDLSLNFIGMNEKIPPLDDARIRQAIAGAIDRRALAELTPATRREAQGILPPGLPCYSPAPKALAYDPDMSRALLTEAGHPGGRGLLPIPLYTAQTGSSEVQKTLNQIRSNLADVGITLEIHQVSWPELNTRVDRHEAALFQLGWVPDIPDPDSFLRSLFEQGGTANYFDYRDDATGQALSRGASETNPIERAHLYRGLEKSVLDAAPLVPLFHSVGLIASRRYVHGLKPGPMGLGSTSFQDVWLSSGGSSN